MITVLYFVLALVALGVLVFIHELGHLIVARLVGMNVEVFSIGFGKPLLKWKWRGVDWQLATLPFGGFVKITGMEFGKRENNQPVDPYTIQGGFFASTPLKRIAVAAAGPVANFLLAFVLFCVLFFMGGREKPFSEYTRIIGWVDPQSEAYSLGVRPGDEITEFNGKPYTNSKDLFYGALEGSKHVELKGYHVNYETKEKTPFTYTITPYLSPLALEDIYTTGISSGASFLIYDKMPSGAENTLQEGSPMERSGIQYGDRLVWADGSLIFSMNQLSSLVNEKSAFLTVQRGSTVFSTRAPKYYAADMAVPIHMRNELIDWSYEAGLKTKWQQLYTLPYMLSDDGTVTGTLTFADNDAKEESKILEPLKVGDRIIGVDGSPVSKGYEILKDLQTKRVTLIVERDFPSREITSWKKGDEIFAHTIDKREINAIAETIGTGHLQRQTSHYAVLNPVEPIRIDEFKMSPEMKAINQKEYEEQKKKVEEVRNLKKRTRMLQILQQDHQKYVLGVALQDRKVDYNPNPFTALVNVFSETWITLKALFSGSLNPKWLSGPIGIVQVIQHGWKVGVGEAIFWISAISVNLGVLNLLPIPILDGGYITLSLWEMITRRKLKARTMERLIIPFVVLLIGLLIFLTFQDVSRFF